MQSGNMFFRQAALVISCGFIVICCKKDSTTGPPPPPSSIAVSGTVQSFGGQGIGDAAVQFFQGNTISGTPLATDSGTSTGHWQIVLSTGGRYTRVITATGFPTSIVSVSIPTDQATVDAGHIVLAAQTINGSIHDAQSNVPIADAVVRFFSGTNSDTSGYAFADLATNDQGQWTGSFTIGSYVCVVYASDLVALVTAVAVTDTTPRQMNSTIVQTEPAGRMRIVLHWGAQPSDLDAHLTGDTSTIVTHPRYHVFYFNPVVTTPTGDTIAVLDRDAENSFGPETITIYRFFPGTLRYKVHDYTNGGTIGSHVLPDSSRAMVRVYTSAGLIRQDTIRADSAAVGNQWYVYDIDGATQQITFVNTLRDSVASPTDTTFRPALLPPKRRVKN